MWFRSLFLRCRRTCLEHCKRYWKRGLPVALDPIFHAMERINRDLRGHALRCDPCDTPETVPRPAPQGRTRRYSALMKNLHIVSLVVTCLLLVSMAFAQAGNPPLPEAPQPQSSSSTVLEQIPSADRLESSQGKLITQARYPRYPGGPMGPRRGMYAPGFPPPPALSPVGALIGFGAGAALGASTPADGTVRGHVALGLIGGAIGALIGGAIGAAAHSFPHSRRTYRPSWAEEGDQESNLRLPSRSTQSPRSGSAEPTPSAPAGFAVTVPPSSPGTPAVAVGLSSESGESETLSASRRISQ
jgi:hypothetical protein